VILLARHGGVLLVGDAVQSYEHGHPDDVQLSELRSTWIARSLVGPMLGFKGRAVVPPMTFTLLAPNKKPEALRGDYEALLAPTCVWDALAMAHGPAITRGAKAATLANLRHVYGPSFMAGSGAAAGTAAPAAAASSAGDTAAVK
jgi:hypothetical protein